MIEQNRIGLLVFFILWFTDKYLNKQKKKGIIGALFLITYFSGRFIVEYFKEYQTLNSSTSALTMGQILSIPFVVIGIIMLYICLNRKNK